MAIITDVKLTTCNKRHCKTFPNNCLMISRGTSKEKRSHLRISYLEKLIDRFNINVRTKFSRS